MKISEAFAEYRRREVIGGGCSINTDKIYMYTGRVVLEYFGDINVKKIRATDVNDFYLYLVEKRHLLLARRPISKNTARSYVLNLRAVIRFCRKTGVNVVNPDEITVPKIKEQSVRFVDDDEYKRFLTEIGRSHRGYSNLNRQRNVLITKMLFHTGLRISELCALNRDSIRNRQFTVSGKSKVPRVCFITEDIESEIAAYLSMRNDNNPALFISNENGERVKPHNIQRIFRRVSCATGIAKVTPHTMRHSFATKMLDEGVDIRYVATFLGHQSLNTTKRYTHVRDRRLHEIYDKVMQ